MVELILSVCAAIWALTAIAFFALALESKVRQDWDELPFRSDLAATDDTELG
jgi:hypothetical protein